MIIFPSCKINLGLNVLEKRSDGFHNLETVMVEVPWKDEISISLTDSDSFHSSGLEIPGAGNLILEALKLARTHANIPPLKITLEKNIPIGAGLGGGSADAAFVYKHLARDYFSGRSTADLENDISALGSDCAFFIQGGIQKCTGKGDILEPIQLNLKGFHLVIINPGIHISTAEAFSKIIPNSDRESVSKVLQLPIKEWKTHLTNDFEKSLFPIYPELEQIKASLYDQGAVYASMTGSGSTIFGIFTDLHDAPTTKIDSAKFMKLISL